MGDPQSIVHWFPDKDEQKCGYCNSASGSVQYGMWAQSLTVNDYQNLIDRGWRRSGQYCYKPVMNETCCPLYTIKCNALEFHPSKSQKKVMKKLNKFLNVGILKNGNDQKGSDETEAPDQGIMDNYKECPNDKVDVNNFSQVESDNYIDMKEDVLNISGLKKSEPVLSKEAACIDRCESSEPKKSKSFKKGDGADPNKLPCKKAKIMRLQNRLKKIGKSSQKINPLSIHQQQGKSLEEFMNEISADDKLNLKTKLIEPTNSASEWNKYEQVEFDLFRRYQNVIHNDPPDKNTMQGFLRFLVNTPLKRQVPNNSKISAENVAYGSYHQQYWLNDKLIAVGVIDILPKCVSAVYFFYDPDYRELTLGTFGALKEIQLARELNPTLNTEHYYMGFYVHTCKKMKYKGNMNPSFLLCPETYEWFPIEKCLGKLEITKYSRFNDDPLAKDANECSLQQLDNMKIIIGNRFMIYKKFKNYFSKQEIFSNVGKLIGKKCIENIFFVES